MGHPIQASHFPLAVTPTGENPLLRNSTDILWPSTLVSENANRECWSRREEFADLGTSQAVSAPAASVSGWGRAAATARAVGAREAVPAPRLPSGSLGGWRRLMPCSPHGEVISPLHAGCCSRRGVPAPAVRARGEGGWLLLQTRLAKC